VYANKMIKEGLRLCQSFRQTSLVLDVQQYTVFFFELHKDKVSVNTRLQIYL